MEVTARDIDPGRFCKTVLQAVLYTKCLGFHRTGEKRFNAAPSWLESLVKSVQSSMYGNDQHNKSDRNTQAIDGVH